MRYISIDSIQPGYKLGKEVIDKDGRLLVAEGTVLTDTIISNLKKIGYNGLVVKDRIFNNDDYFNSVIQQDLKFQIGEKLKSTLNKSDEKGLPNLVDVAKQISTVLVDKIIGKKEVKLNLQDLKLYDDYTFFHSINVAIIALVLGQNMNLDKEQMKELGIAAILHDLGKIFIDPDILGKPGKLTKSEFKIVQDHSKYGYEVLKQAAEFDEYIYESVRGHHEKFDGTGYPDGKKGSQIPLFARIITVSDVYDALTSKRVYRNALFYGEAIEYIMANSSVMFEPEIVKVFLNSIYPYPIGTHIVLSNGEEAYVKDVKKGFVLRPVVLIKDTDRIVDLAKDKKYLSVTIVNVL
jgi:HD-GYP domain-containing protein (c-di-GMP phosphodiesterase class II)